MKTIFEPCFCLDLDALCAERADDDTDAPHPAARNVTESCAGKTLLMLSPRGFEVVHVPALLH